MKLLVKTTGNNYLSVIADKHGKNVIIKPISKLEFIIRVIFK